MLIEGPEVDFRFSRGWRVHRFRHPSPCRVGVKYSLSGKSGAQRTYQSARGYPDDLPRDATLGSVGDYRFQEAILEIHAATERLNRRSLIFPPQKRCQMRGPEFAVHAHAITFVTCA